MSVSPISEPIQAAATESAGMSSSTDSSQTRVSTSLPASALADRFSPDFSRVLREWVARSTARETHSTSAHSAECAGGVDRSADQRSGQRHPAPSQLPAPRSELARA